MTLKHARCGRCPAVIYGRTWSEVNAGLVGHTHSVHGMTRDGYFISGQQRTGCIESTFGLIALVLALLRWWRR